LFLVALPSSTEPPLLGGFFYLRFRSHAIDLREIAKIEIRIESMYIAKGLRGEDAPSKYRINYASVKYVVVADCGPLG